MRPLDAGTRLDVKLMTGDLEFRKRWKPFRKVHENDMSQV